MGVAWLAHGLEAPESVHRIPSGLQCSVREGLPCSSSWRSPSRIVAMEVRIGSHLPVESTSLDKWSLIPKSTECQGLG